MNGIPLGCRVDETAGARWDQYHDVQVACLRWLRRRGLAAPEGATCGERLAFYVFGPGAQCRRPGRPRKSAQPPLEIEP